MQWHNVNQFCNNGLYSLLLLFCKNSNDLINFFFLDNDFEQNINEQYIKQKLESSLGKLWHDIQSRVAILITNASVVNLKFDDFLQVLSILHKYDFLEVFQACSSLFGLNFHGRL